MVSDEEDDDEKVLLSDAAAVLVAVIVFAGAKTVATASATGIDGRRSTVT